MIKNHNQTDITLDWNRKYKIDINVYSDLFRTVRETIMLKDCYLTIILLSK